MKLGNIVLFLEDDYFIDHDCTQQYGAFQCLVVIPSNHQLHSRVLGSYKICRPTRKVESTGGRWPFAKTARGSAYTVRNPRRECDLYGEIWYKRRSTLIDHCYPPHIVIESITSKREPQEFEALYLLMPTTQNVDRIIKDFTNHKQYPAAHLFFTEGRPSMSFALSIALLCWWYGR